MIRKWKAYREKTAQESIPPLGFREFAARQLAGHLIVYGARKSFQRGDHLALNQARLVTWAGNDGTAAENLAKALPPDELNKAIREDRLTLSVTAPKP